MNSAEGHTSQVDVVLEQLARVTVPADVQQRLETCCDEFCGTSRSAEPRRSRVMVTRRWLVGAAVAASMAATVALLAVGNRDAWAHVARAIQAQPWVRFTVQRPDGVAAPEDFEAAEHWLSSKHKVIAGKRGRRADFLDLERRELYSYFPDTHSVQLSTSRDEQIGDFGSIETLRRLVSSEGMSTFRLPTSAVEIVERSQQEIERDGRRWTEFTFQCRNPKRTPNEYQVIVRVDPASGLPVELRSTEKLSRNQPFNEWRLAIDYPETGPNDIYALGVPRDAVVVDRRSVETENGQEIEQFLAAYEAARQQPQEPFSVETVQESAGRLMPKEAMLDLPELRPDRVGYPDILLGKSPVNNPECKVTLDRRPAAGPEGTVLLHILTETTVGSNDCFYWIAPDKDYLVLRSEIHFSGEDHVEWHNSTRIIDHVEQSPAGRWYATVVRLGRIKKHGDDLSNDPLPRDPRPVQDRNPMPIGPVNTTMLRYKVAFGQP